MPACRPLLILPCLFLLVAPVTGQEWTRFRGPNGSGIGQADLPLQWTDKDFNWKVQVPGTGHSSPVLWSDKVFLTSGDSQTGKRYVLCLNADSGTTLWSKDFDGPKYKMHLRNSIATQLHNDTGTIFIRFVGNVGDAFDDLVVYQVSYLFGKGIAAHLVRHLGDYDLLFA